MVERIKRDRTGELHWCPLGTREAKEVAGGTLVKWKEGKVGGTNEYEMAELTVPEFLSPEELAKIAEAEKLKTGSCWGESRQPRDTAVPIEAGVFYLWVYCTSTN